MKTITGLHGIQFKLLKHNVIELEPMPYCATRLDIRNAIQKRKPVMFFLGEEAVIYPAPVTLTKTSIEIGCQKFEGENFKKLKAWALAR